MEPNDEAGEDQFSKLVGECLEAYNDHGVEAVQKVLDDAPEYADRVRERMQALAKVGLLEGSEQTPRQFGPYAIIRRIGRGGMSEVFLAHDARMKRDVALKCAHPGLALEERAQKRFQREVEAVAKLAHPAIVPVYDAGESEGRAYFTMEYADGATLSDLIKDLIDNASAQSPLPRAKVIAENVEPARAWPATYIEIVCGWMLELAEALEHAHQVGVIHRDVTPSNIIIRKTGHAQLFDFGLAMLQDAPSLTMFGEFTGTPYYVSPEQLTGTTSGLDERCDIYSIGVTLFELLTLRRPFEGKSTAEVLNRIQTLDPVSPRVHNPRIPRDLELICLTALDRDLNRRYASMADLAADLRAFLAFEPVKARPIGSAERALRFIKRRPAFASALALGAVVFLVLPPVLIGMNASIRTERDLAVASTERAKVAAEQAERIADEFEELLVGLFETENLTAENLTASELVSRGVERLARLGDLAGVKQTSPANIEVNLAMQEASGRAFLQMKQYERANQILRKVVIDRRQLPGGAPSNLARTILLLSRSMMLSGDPDTAHQQLARLISESEAHVLRPDEMVTALLVMSSADQRLGNMQGAAAHLDQALEVQLDIEQLPLRDAQRITSYFGVQARAVGRIDMAVKMHHRWLALLERAWNPDAKDVSLAHFHLAESLKLAPQADSLQSAQVHAERSRAIDQRAIAWSQSITLEPPSIAIDFHTSWQAESHATFSAGLLALGENRLSEARLHFEDNRKVRPRNPLVAINLAIVAIKEGEPAVALEWLHRAIEFGLGQSPLLTPPLARNPNFETLLGTPVWIALQERMALSIQAPLPMHFTSGQTGAPIVVHLGDSSNWPQTGRAALVESASQQLGWNLISITPLGAAGPGNPTWMEHEAKFDEQLARMSRLIIERMQDELGTDMRLGADLRPPLFIIGEGDAGPFATQLAFRYPGLFKGLALIDSFPGPLSRTPDMRNAATFGLPVAIIDDPSGAVEWIQAGTTQAQFTNQVAAWFEAHTFEVTRHNGDVAKALERLAANAKLSINEAGPAANDASR